jgi:hypothetical protein
MECQNCLCVLSSNVDHVAHHSLMSLSTSSPSSGNGVAAKDGMVQSTVRKRNRPMLSCVTCHERRVKCNRMQPCQSCVDYGLPDQCLYAAKPNKRAKGSASRTTSQKISVPYEDVNPMLAQYRAALFPKTEKAQSTMPLMSLTTFVERVSRESRFMMAPC